MASIAGGKLDFHGGDAGFKMALLSTGYKVAMLAEGKALRLYTSEALP